VLYLLKTFNQGSYSRGQSSNREDRYQSNNEHRSRGYQPSTYAAHDRPPSGGAGPYHSGSGVAPNPYPSDSGLVIGRGVSRGRVRQEGGAPGYHNQNERMAVAAARPPSMSYNRGDLLHLIKSSIAT